MDHIYAYAGHSSGSNATATAGAAAATTSAASSGGHGAYNPARAKYLLLNFNSAKEFIYFTFAFVGAAMLVNIYSVLWALWRRRQLTRGHTAPRAYTRKTGAARLPGALLTAGRIVMYRWRIPAVNMYVLEVIMTVLYTLAMLLWTFTRQTTNGYANRAGFIAAAQTPLLVALAMKNNIIGWATGVGHEKLTCLHRAVSRALLLEVWIHGIGWFRISPQRAVANIWRKYGVVAGVSFAVLVFLTFAPVRRRFYESFFLIHTIFAVMYLVFLDLHLKGDGHLDYYVWPCFAIWGFDRFCRYLRYAILSGVDSPNRATAEIELLNPDTIRVTATRRVPLGWRAGQHFFLCFPTLGPFESHPFSIANIAEEGKYKKVVWIVRTRDGLTGRLLELVNKKGGKATAPLFMDGPYGGPPDLSGFSTSVFFAGGSGVAYTLPRFHDLILRTAANKACARRIVFIWAIRHASHLHWLSDSLRAALAAAPADISVQVQVYVTSDGPVDCDPQHTLDDDGASGSGSSDPEKDSYDEKSGMPGSPASPSSELILGVEMRSGRPDVYAILEDAVAKSEGPVSVDVSGPHALVTTIREALSGTFASPLAVLKGAPTVQLNVEDFTM